jgi:hypothetical protein
LNLPRFDGHGNSKKFLRRFGARRVILCGSVVTDRYLPGHSDIDIFFEGVPRNKETQLTGKTLLAFPEWPLDLRPSGYCEDQFRKENRALRSRRLSKEQYLSRLAEDFSRLDQVLQRLALIEALY